MTKTLGSWAFLMGVILAIIFGIFGISDMIAWILVILGIIIGLLNITESEIQPFLWAGTVLVIVAYFGGAVMNEIAFIGTILNALLYLFVPATIIVALKSVFSLAKK